MAMAADLITDSGVSLDDTHSLLAALHQSVLRNFEAADPGEALTGPLVRGDIGTLTTHLELLDELAPEVAALYRAMGKATARFALQSGRINNVSARAIEDALSEGVRGRPYACAEHRCNACVGPRLIYPRKDA